MKFTYSKGDLVRVYPRVGDDFSERFVGRVLFASDDLLVSNIETGESFTVGYGQVEYNG